MKKLILLLFAVLPFGIGYLINYVMQEFDWYGISILIVSGLFFFYWFMVGRISVKCTKTVVESLMIGNSFAIITIILIVFQEVYLGRYFPNIIGILSQMFYLPALSVTARLSDLLPIHTMWGTYILTFLVMTSIYYIGFKLKQKKIEDN